MDPLITSIFDCTWDLGSKFFRWLFDGWYKPSKIDFEPLWNETKVINSIGDKPILKSQNKTSQTQTFTFTIPVGMTIDNFIRNKAAIAQYLHENPKNIRIELLNNLATITIYDTSKLSFDYKDYKFNFKTHEIRVPIGINLKTFETAYWLPASSNECNLLIGGSTGAGKSVCLNVIMEYLINRDDVELYLQDTKLVDLVDYENAPQTKVYNEGTNYSIETIKALTDEMASRYKYLKAHKYKNVNEIKEENKPKYIFYVVEELASFNPKDHKEFYKGLAELLAKGRAAGIIIILTTQAPYAEILPGMLKNNINTIIGLKTRTQEASKVICGDYESLIGLRGRGHGRLFNAAGTSEIQVFNI